MKNLNPKPLQLLYERAREVASILNANPDASLACPFCELAIREKKQLRLKHGENYELDMCKKCWHQSAMNLLRRHHCTSEPFISFCFREGWRAYKMIHEED
jgi:hypothetical protein